MYAPRVLNIMADLERDATILAVVVVSTRRAALDIIRRRGRGPDILFEAPGNPRPEDVVVITSNGDLVQRLRENPNGDTAVFCTSDDVYSLGTLMRWHRLTAGFALVVLPLPAGGAHVRNTSYTLLEMVVGDTVLLSLHDHAVVPDAGPMQIDGAMVARPDAGDVEPPLPPPAAGSPARPADEAGAPPRGHVDPAVVPDAGATQIDGATVARPDAGDVDDVDAGERSGGRGYTHLARRVLPRQTRGGTEEEKAEKERAKEAAKEAKLRDRLVAMAQLLEDREDREAVPAPKPAKPAKSLDLKGQPDGLTKDMVVEFMQTYIPTHYLLGETLAWRELIEPELRAAHGDLDWREIPDSSRNKNTLLRSMKAIWKEIGGDSQLPTDLDEIPLEPAVAAKLAKLEAYIEKRIEIVAASERSEKEGEAAADLAARGEIELRTKKLEKYACEACLAWWCLRTGKPSLNSLGTEAKLEQFIAGQIHKRWFPRGKPGTEDVDWEGKKQDGDRLIESKTKWKPIVPKSTQKLQAVVENGSIVWKMVDVPQDVDEAEVEKRRLEEEREAAELAKERDELEEKLRASYALQIGANLREFLKAWKSVNETKLNSEVMDAFGLAWGARTGKSADDEQLAAEDAASWWEG